MYSNTFLFHFFVSIGGIKVYNSKVCLIYFRLLGNMFFEYIFSNREHWK